MVVLGGHLVQIVGQVLFTLGESVLAKWVRVDNGLKKKSQRNAGFCVYEGEGA